MKEALKRLIILKQMHSFQVIATFGFIMSVLAHVIMLLLNRQVPSFLYIYPTWVLVFISGYILNLFQNNSGHHH